MRTVLEYGRIEGTCVHCCVSWEWRTIEVSPHPTVCHCGEAVARVVYLAQDRLDLGVAAAEPAKTLAIPREGDDERPKRVARHLHGHPDYMQWYTVQEETNTNVLSTDAEWGHMS